MNKCCGRMAKLTVSGPGPVAPAGIGISVDCSKCIQMHNIKLQFYSRWYMPTTYCTFYEVIQALRRLDSSDEISTVLTYLYVGRAAVGRPCWHLLEDRGYPGQARPGRARSSSGSPTPLDHELDIYTNQLIIYALYCHYTARTYQAFKCGWSLWKSFFFKSLHSGQMEAATPNTIGNEVVYLCGGMNAITFANVFLQGAH